VRRTLVEALALAGLGALQTLAFVHTDAWMLPIAAAALLVWRLNGAGPGRAAVLGWAYGTGWLCAGVWWLFISMHFYGGLPAWMAALAVFALAAALSLYLAAAAAVYARWRRGRVGPDALLFACLWLLAEWARGVLFTGFPWVAAGYAQVDSPLAALAPWVGVYGMGFAVALAAGLLGGLGSLGGRLVHIRRGALGLAVVALLLLPWLLPRGAVLDFTRPAGSLQVRLLQPNVPQDEKFAAERLPQTLSWVARNLIHQPPGARTPDLVVAPETAVPLLPEQLQDMAPGYWEALQQHFRSPGPDGRPRAALVGVPLGGFDSGYTNSVAGLSAQPQPGVADGADYRYDKWHLVPFGEFIPTGFRWFTRMMNIPLGDFARGVPNPPSFAVGTQRVAPNICYEDLFGEELARRFVDAATAPTVLANVSNIGWFGQTMAVPQHLHISRLRSLELQRPMLRATNTGATALIDHRGRVQALLPPHTEGVLEGEVLGREGTTPYAAWAGRWDLWPLLALALAGVGLLARRRGPVSRTGAA
jgi:apolipoprotein N-acyltransferase